MRRTTTKTPSELALTIDAIEACNDIIFWELTDVMWRVPRIERGDSQEEVDIWFEDFEGYLTSVDERMVKAIRNIDKFFLELANSKQGRQAFGYCNTKNPLISSFYLFWFYNDMQKANIPMEHEDESFKAMSRLFRTLDVSKEDFLKIVDYFYDKSEASTQRNLDNGTYNEDYYAKELVQIDRDRNDVKKSIENLWHKMKI